MKTSTFTTKLIAEACLAGYKAKDFSGYILTLNARSFELRVWR